MLSIRVVTRNITSVPFYRDGSFFILFKSSSRRHQIEGSQDVGHKGIAAQDAVFLTFALSQALLGAPNASTSALLMLVADNQAPCAFY
ncbi:hypothetical protein BA724_17445 [Domibacillus iocasae]|uniref:Uncharacterized protein n=1 Tax=Domibacillus iocasae TaxID=1714016 RepID=A0A1E7DQV9_9BACI|nr:hypothetical protein BA724_17445 [Domibacillus iocasae]